MKLRNLFLMLIISSYALYAAQEQEYKQPLVVNVNVHTANQSHLDQQNDIHQNSNQNYHCHDTKKVFSHTEQLMYDFFKHQYDLSSKASQTTLAWISDHKVETSCLGLIGLYCYCMWKIYTSHKLLESPNSWYMWYSAKPLQTLFTTTQQVLQADLLFAVQTKYVHPENPTDFIYPLVQALQALQKEITIIEEIIFLHQTIIKCCATRLFFIENYDLENLEEQHKKLLFIKQVLTTWCAQYKINKYTQS